MPAHRQTNQFERFCKDRTTVERANARLKIYCGADDSNVTGSALFHAFFGLIIAMHAGTAIMLAAAPRNDGKFATTHLSYVGRQPRQKIGESRSPNI